MTMSARGSRASNASSVCASSKSAGTAETAVRQVFHARVLVRARPGQLQQTQVFGLRQLGFTRLAENNRSRAKLLCGRVFAVLRERERALRAESGI